MAELVNNSKVTIKTTKIVIMVQKTRVVDILVNCCKNSWEVMWHIHGKRMLTLSFVCLQKNSVRVEIPDNVEGIFTKEDGFGLHRCAIVKTESGGRIPAHSNGPGQGSTFPLASHDPTYIRK